MDDLTEQWTRLMDWCRLHAPVTLAGINPPADPALLESVESATGREWPDELRAWFTLHNGSDQGHTFPQIMPGFRPLTLTELLDDWRSLTSIWASMTDEFGGDALLRDPAGTTAFTYIESYIPIAANNSRDNLVIDTRSGDANGCVVQFLGENTDDGAQPWPSIAAMLAEVTDSLDANTPCRGWVPYVDGGQLVWDYP